ncbi:hypothetical protein [Streptomyces sp. NPDC057238]|uniref:hypothetical protein n=1 Tax=Streptomyces sp. NPDC057238 TaxID=3346060 RepID=UPI003645837A
MAKIVEASFTNDDQVREVTHDFDTDGFGSLHPKYKGGRPKIEPTKKRAQFLVFCRCPRILYPPEVHIAIVRDGFSLRPAQRSTMRVRTTTRDEPSRDGKGLNR